MNMHQPFGVQIKNYQKGDLVFGEYDLNDYYYYILKGVVELRQFFEESERYELYGERSFFPMYQVKRGTYNKRAVCISDELEVVLIKRPNNNDSELERLILLESHKLAERNEVISELKTAYGKNKKIYVEKFLKILLKEVNITNVDGNYCLPNSVTQAKLSNLLGITRQGLNQIFQELRESKILITKKNHKTLIFSKGFVENML
ncbi:hypothetical protein FC40_GL000102 [Ligilactobacillus hayakitensis DSM 18933 = JCM 14209]|uniref:Cyclic nucleotide-binding domain-containing protein n=2 Tax=Ligilactobacillus TaxID=2767887 RepID=A0A0R1WNC3_9LACO|nr:hypothetical protein FC40_GL000102 [Ligilactobacillus hayakitensis DSM 18933 = JCM 14209]